MNILGLIAEYDSQGRLIDTDKWDNHNTIARGWAGVSANYQPVTFRKIYGTKSVHGPSGPSTPMPTSVEPKSPPPAAVSNEAAPEDPSGLEESTRVPEEGYADL